MKKYKVKCKTELPLEIKKVIMKHKKKPKREIAIPLTSKTFRKYGKLMKIGDLKKL